MRKLSYLYLLQKSLSSLELPRVISVANGARLHHSPSTDSATDNSKRINGIASGGISTVSKYSGKKKYKVPDPAHDLSVQVLEKFSLVTKLAREATTQLFREIQDNHSPLRDKKLQPATIASQPNSSPTNTLPKSDDIEGTSVDSKVRFSDSKIVNIVVHYGIDTVLLQFSN